MEINKMTNICKVPIPIQVRYLDIIWKISIIRYKSRVANIKFDKPKSKE